MDKARVVLIAEDSEPYGSTLEIAVSKLPNVEIWHAANGEEAWGLLAGGAGVVSALLTDLQMPVLDGFGLIERIRSSPAHALLPIVVLSGCADPVAARRASELGADAFFEKPYSPALVRATLERLLYERDLSRPR